MPPICSLRVVAPHGAQRLRRVLAAFQLWSGLLADTTGAAEHDALELVYGDPGGLPARPQRVWIARGDCGAETGSFPLRMDDGGVRLEADLVTLVDQALSYAPEDGTLSFGNFHDERVFQAAPQLYQRPLVNEAFAALKHALLLAAGRRGLLFRSAHPGGADFSFALTHDIDYLRHSPLNRLKMFRAAAKAVRRQPLSRIDGGRLLHHLVNWRAFDLALLRDIEMHHGVRSVLNFSGYLPQAGDGLKCRLLNPDYDVRSLKLDKLLEHFELGIHGSTVTPAHPRRYLAELARVATHGPVRGGRQHMLACRFPDTFRTFEQAGFAYDTTMGFNDTCGFRAGGAVPHHPHHPQDLRPYPFFEYPLIFMDSVLTKDGIFAPQRIVARTAELGVRAAQASMTASICWHDVAFYAGSPLADAYDQALATWRKQRGALLPPAELARFHSAVEAIKLRPAGNAWELTLPQPVPGGLQVWHETSSQRQLMLELRADFRGTVSLERQPVRAT
jgi:hypothetical protein